MKPSRRECLIGIAAFVILLLLVIGLSLEIIFAVERENRKWPANRPWRGYFYYTHFNGAQGSWQLKTSVGIDVEPDHIELQWIDNGEVGERSRTYTSSKSSEQYINHLTENWDWMVVPDDFLWSSISDNGGPGSGDYIAKQRWLIFRFDKEVIERTGIRPGTSWNVDWPPPITLRVLVIPKTFVIGLECAARELVLAE